MNRRNLLKLLAGAPVATSPAGIALANLAAPPVPLQDVAPGHRSAAGRVCINRRGITIYDEAGRVCVRIWSV